MDQTLLGAMIRHYPHLMGVMARMTRLDQRAEDRFSVKSPDVWRKKVGRWWLMLVAAGCYVGAALIFAALADNSIALVMALSGLLPVSVLMGYLAGQLKAEDDRLNGRDPFAKRRPPGL